jgi:hypothetical protein
MTSVFAMATFEDALAFRAEHRAGFHAGVWQVQAECAHRGNMKLVGSGANGATAIQNARSYWRGDRAEASELWELHTHPRRRVAPSATSSAGSSLGAATSIRRSTR